MTDLNETSVLSTLTVKELSKLTRKQLITNLKKRNITMVEEGKKYLNRKELAQKLFDYFENYEDDSVPVDRTIYETASEGSDSSEPTDDSNSQTQKELKSSLKSKNCQNNQQWQYPRMPNPNPQQFQMDQFMQCQNPFMFNNNYPNLQNYHQMGSQNFQQAQNFQMPRQFPQYNRQNVTFDIDDIENNCYEVSTMKSQSMVRRHPYCCNLGKLGLHSSKDLREISDWNLIRSVILWSPQSKSQIIHRDSLLYAAARITHLEDQPWAERQAIQAEGSLLCKVFNAVDCLCLSNVMKRVETNEIDKYVNDFEKITTRCPVPRTGQYLRQAQSTSQVTYCWAYNSARGCKNQSCKHSHACNRCGKTGKIANHPGYKCATFT